MSALITVTDAGDVVITHHWIDRLLGRNAGKYAVVKVERTLRDDGSIAMVCRTTVDVIAGRAEAADRALELDKELAQ